MKKNLYIFENNEGQSVRRINWNADRIIAIVKKDTGRIEFVENTSDLGKAKVSFKTLADISTSDIQKGPVAVAGVGKLKLFDAVTLNPKMDAVVEAEDKKQLPFFLKRSAIGHAAALVILFISAFIINKFTPEKEELITVTVFEQKREAKPPARTVEVAKKKVAKTNRQARTQPRRAQRTTKAKPTRVAAKPTANTRSGTNTQNQGLLGALGGTQKRAKGSGGVNVNANRNTGTGYSASAAKGGHSRGLPGKGLVATGSGSSGQIQGYAGLGTKGKGSGSPGYGATRIAGSSGAYFQALGEESLIEGGLDPDQINAVVQRNRGHVIYCYEQGLQVEPRLSGRVAINFVINARGNVSTARVSNTSLRSSKVESCIVQKLRGWKFPEPTGNVNVRVTYPFELKRLSQG